MEQFLDFLLRHWMLTGTFVILLAWLFQTGTGSVVQGIKTLSVSDAISKVNHDKGIFIDVRPEEKYQSGYIVNSVNIPLASLSDKPKKLPRTKSKPIIVVCQIGQSAIKGAKLLEEAGYENVFVLRGGIKDWQFAEMPLVTKES